MRLSIDYNDDIEIYFEYLSSLKNITYRLKPSDKPIALDNFNLPCVSWVINDDRGCYIPFSHPLIYKECFDGVHWLGLCQLNNIFNMDTSLSAFVSPEVYLLK